MLKGIVKKKKKLHKIAFSLVFLMLTLCPQAFEQHKESSNLSTTRCVAKGNKIYF